MDKMAAAKKDHDSKLLKEIKEKVKAVLESNAHANYIVDLIELADTEDEKIVAAFIKAVHKIFITFLSQKIWSRQSSTKSLKIDGEEGQEKADESTEDPQEVFSVWLHEKYLLAVKKLLGLLHHNTQSIQELALCTLMKFLVGEAKASKKTSYYFPNTLFRKICDALFDANHDMRVIIGRFGDYLEYSDVVYYVLKNLGKLLQERSPATGKYQAGNTFALLSQIKMKQADEELDEFLVKPEKSKKAKEEKSPMTFQHNVMQLNSHRKVFSTAWLQFLGRPLTQEIHKKVLLSLHSEVIPHMTDPKLLMDFLTDSYNIGGATSLLALNGLFILIHQHNLDYPQFYRKLYALFEPSVFHVKYRSRFFHLTDLFLSSTHLPAYLVAAFAKRLSRLALTAPPSGAMLVIPFVCNLIKRHPSCQVLIHRKQVSPEETFDINDNNNCNLT